MASLEFDNDINDHKSVLSESPQPDCEILAKRPKRIRKPNTRIFGDITKDSSMKFITPSSRKKKSKKKSGNPMKRGRQLSQLQMRRQNAERALMIQPAAVVADRPLANTISVHERQRLHRFGARLRNFLKLSKPYRWVCYEWFYSNLDKCLFSGDNDFCVCLREYFPKLQTRMLTKAEWNRIRQLMGRPRRCSPSFFAEERQVLYRKRDKLRKLQQRKLTHLDDISDMPKEIPMPMIIGTSITAHIEDGVYSGLYSGVIDAVDTVNSQYRITFDKQALGTRYLPDYTVMGNDLPDTMPAVAFLHKERPTNTGSYNSIPTMSSLLTPSIKSDFSSEYDSLFSIKSPFSNAAPEESNLGGFPVKFLMMISQLSKILSLKSEIINRLKQMHSVAEYKVHLKYGKSLDQDCVSASSSCSSISKKFSNDSEELQNVDYDSHFQIQYANAVVKLETLNKTLTDVLLLIQHAENTGRLLGDQNAEPKPAIEGNLRNESFHEAHKIVTNCNTKNGEKVVGNDNMIKLITMLVSLLVQVKIFAEKEIPSFEYVSLHKTLKEIKGLLSPENVQRCEDLVDVHIRHIETGLSQVGNQPAFIAEEEVVTEP